MTAYATTDNVADGFRALSQTECDTCAALLEEAAVVIDAYAPHANADRKRVVSCRMVRRAFAAMNAQNIIMGSTQGTVTAGPYSQSWTFGSGASAGDLYLTSMEKRILGVGNSVGMSKSPLEPDCSCGKEFDCVEWN